MTETPESEHANAAAPISSGSSGRMAEVEAWFIREVLPLESVLIQFLNRSGWSKTDVEDLCQDVYMRVCAAALEEFPKQPRALVFTVARNLLIDRVRHEQIVSIDAVENLDVLNVAIEEPPADRVIIAREELRRLQGALEKLPARIRNVIIFHKVNGLTLSEIATRTGSTERTVRRDLSEGVRALAEILLREPPDGRRAS